jgi:hypothetical protein
MRGTIEMDTLVVNRQRDWLEVVHREQRMRALPGMEWH